jgi:hypothetical protein
MDVLPQMIEESSNMLVHTLARQLVTRCAHRNDKGGLELGCFGYLL